MKSSPAHRFRSAHPFATPPPVTIQSGIRRSHTAGGTGTCALQMRQSYQTAQPLGTCAAASPSRQGCAPPLQAPNRRITRHRTHRSRTPVYATAWPIEAHQSRCASLERWRHAPRAPRHWLGYRRLVTSGRVACDGMADRAHAHRKVRITRGHLGARVSGGNADMERRHQQNSHRP